VTNLSNVNFVIIGLLRNPI